MTSTIPSEADFREFGEVVLVRFLFTDQVSFKHRPAVVISNREYHAARPDFVIMAITSQLRASAGIGEVWIDDWRSSNLLKPSAVKPVFATIEVGLILRTLGYLQPADQTRLREAIAAVWG